MATKVGDIIPGYVEVVRREVVGRITLDPNGRDNPLVAAFGIAAEYIAENDSSNGVALEFELWDRKYRAILDPVEDRRSTPDNDPYAVR